MRGYYAQSEYYVHCNFEGRRYHYHISGIWDSYVYKEPLINFLNTMEHFELKVVKLEVVDLDDLKRQIENLFPEFKL